MDVDLDAENEDLTEVPFSDEIPIEDDESSQYTADNDDERLDVQIPVVEMALCIFTGHSDSVYKAVVNPKIPGQVISGGGDDKGYLWRYSCNGDQPGYGTVVEQVELLGHQDTVTSVGFNFDGTLALTGSYDGTVRIWNTTSGSLVQVLEGPVDVEWAEFHSKGNAVLAGSKDGTIWMWMAHNGQCVQVFAG